jgi:hypothetical protein
MSIYEVRVNYQQLWPEVAQQTSKLDADIQRLAKASGEKINLYQYAEATDGQPPAIFLECSEAFLEKVKRLPLFDSVAPLNGKKVVNRSDAPQIEAPEAIGNKNKGPKGP